MGQMATDMALRVFNDLGRLVTPTFFPQADFIYNYVSSGQK